MRAVPRVGSSSRVPRLLERVPFPRAAGREGRGVSIAASLALILCLLPSSPAGVVHGHGGCGGEWGREVQLGRGQGSVRDLARPGRRRRAGTASSAEWTGRVVAALRGGGGKKGGARESESEKESGDEDLPVPDWTRLREAVSVRRHGGGQDMGAAALAELKQTVVGELARCMTAAAAGAAERRSARSPHGSQHGSQHGGGRAGDVAESGGDAEEDAGGGGRVRLLGAGREWRELGAGRDWREGGRAVRLEV